MSFIWAWLFTCVASHTACEHDAHGLLQLAKVGPETWKSGRDLATIYERAPMTWGDLSLSFYSAVPTFGPDGNYIALLHPYQDSLWNRSQKHALYCSGDSGVHRSRVRVVGGERGVAYKLTLAFLCDWPGGDKDKDGFEVVLEDADHKEVGRVHAWHNPGLLKQYHTMACLRDVWPSRRSGLKLLAEWLEFNFMHGLEHLIVYTSNIHTQELVDVYTPYIQSGLASRVHMNYTYIPNNNGLQSIAASDCVFRAKNHATWLIPTTDVDEFLVMKDESLFGGSVPRDYLSSAWDAIVKREGFQTNQVHAIYWERYNFAATAPEEVELSSTLRQQKVFPACPKFLLNVKVVDTIFIHWPTSFREGTEGIHLTPEKLVAHHYREQTGLKEFMGGDVPYDTTDTSLQQDAAPLQAALTKRHGKAVGTFLKDLSSVPAATLISWLDDDNDFEIELSKRFAPWIRRLTESREVQLIEPPRRLIDVAGPEV